MINQMYAASVDVHDVDAALDFFVNTLGFAKTADDTFPDGMRWTTVQPAGGGTSLALNLNPEARPHPIGCGITFSATDLDGLYETLSAKGVAFDGPPAIMPWGAKGAVFADPTGNKYFIGE